MKIKEYKKQDLLEAVGYVCSEDDGDSDGGSCSNSGNGCTGSCNHSSK